MKKAILILGLFLICAMNYAQDQKYEYCEIVGTSNVIGNKVTIQIDFGEAKKLTDDTRYKDDSGKPVKFNSMVDALNFMGEERWKLSQAYAVTTSGQSIYHYLLERVKL